MNTDILHGKWEQIKGQVKQQWGKLTDDDITVISGKRDQLVGKVQERYGFAKDQAQRDVDSFLHTCGCGEKSASKDADVSNSPR